MVHAAAVTCLDFSHDGQLLVSGDLYGTIQVWKIIDGKCLRKFDAQLSKESSAVTRVMLNLQRSKVFAIFPQAKVIRILGLKSGSVLREIKDTSQGFLQQLEFVAVHTNKGVELNDELIMTCTSDGVLSIYS